MGGYVAMMLLLGGMVFAMYAATRILRSKLGVGAGTLEPGALRIVGKRTLDQRRSLFVVELPDRYLIVGSAEGSVSLVDHLSVEEFNAMATPPVAADEEGKGAVVAFRSVLDRARNADKLIAARRAERAGTDTPQVIDMAASGDS